RTTVKRLPPQIMPPRSYSISSGERDVMVTLTSLHCQTSCHGRNGGGFGGASPSSAHDMPAAKMMANTGASVFIVVLSFPVKTRLSNNRQLESQKFSPARIKA